MLEVGGFRLDVVGLETLSECKAHEGVRIRVLCPLNLASRGSKSLWYQ